ncbi:MAG: pyridoxal-dependent decarboxylase [Alphaproteobacteria bacterium]|jgi:glutamate/tyrosine decarboxylase-like PLP-dependent enzyme|nr:pyridoxal-dependent decarboxylase [Alphaproteobacteria bacterium]MDP6812223.1 pyridoxal-dependent decarboxylase [Alphaproteobacteria bacterium]
MTDRQAFPKRGSDWPALEAEMAAMSGGDIDWRGGRTPLFVFDGDDGAREVGRRAFMNYFDQNALGGKRAFFGLKRMEDEIVEMGLDLFRAPMGAAGNLTTGGSESIFLAVKACRDWARARGGMTEPFNIVAPFSAHPAFNKAGDVMDIAVHRLATGADGRADATALAAATDGQTMMLVGSAPCFPHGVVDPIAELGELAAERDIWLHVDACVGGYLAPFFQRIGRPVPEFDFAIPGVRSLTADLHKFGFCPKPASTVFYRRAEDHDRGVFQFEDWPHGPFATATLSGTRAGGAVAAAWAVLRHLGEDGYVRVARDLAAMTDAYVAGITAIDGLHLWAQPDLTIINFGAHAFDIFAVAERLEQKGWLPGLTRSPKGLHAMLSMYHEPAREQYLADLAEAVARVRETGGTSQLQARY